MIFILKKVKSLKLMKVKYINAIKRYLRQTGNSKFLKIKTLRKKTTRGKATKAQKEDSEKRERLKTWIPIPKKTDDKSERAASS